MAWLAHLEIIAVPQTLLKYSKSIGPFKTAQLIVANKVRPESLMRLDVKGTKTWARAETHDMPAVPSVLDDRDYDDVQHEDPRVMVDVGAHIGPSALFFATK